VPRDFRQLKWDAALVRDCRQLVKLAVREDVGRGSDWTTLALVPADAIGRAALVTRRAGIIAGLPVAKLTLEQIDPKVNWSPLVEDGAAIEAGATVARLEGSARSLLTAERLVLNFVGRLSGIATLTRQYVAAVEGTRARIYDTRKTTPAWRRLEKYAVRCGGGRNHRTGLFDAILIKDNHLAVGATGPARFSPAQAVEQTRQFLEQNLSARQAKQMLVEVEVDSLEQLEEVLKVKPDIVLLDNMRPEQLQSAVARRNALAPRVSLEASGGVDLNTVGAIAATGVERISVGALTHSAVTLDVGLDWE
jgi:nicotinate-nucleotide pyrophosphorylase (carboxylating)